MRSTILNRSDAGLLIGAVLVTSSTSMNNVYMGLHVTGIGAPLSFVGLVYVAALFSTILGRIIAGRMIDRGVPVRRLMSLGIVLMSSGSLSIAITNQFGIITIFNAVRGLGAGIYHVSFVSAISHMTRREASVIITGPPLGMAIGPSMASALYLVTGTRGIMLASAVLYLISGPLVPSVLRTVETEPEENDGSKASINPEVVAMLYNRAVVSYVIGTLYTTIPFYAISLGMGGEHVGLMFVVAALTNAMIRPINVRLSLGTRMETFLSQVMLVSSLLSLASGNVAFVWISMILYGMGSGIFISTSLLSISEIAPSGRRGHMAAMLTLMIDVGGSLGSFFSPILYGQYGPQMVFVVTSAAIASGVVATLMSCRYKWGVDKARELHS